MAAELPASGTARRGDARVSPAGLPLQPAPSAGPQQPGRSAPEAAHSPQRRHVAAADGGGGRAEVPPARPRKSLLRTSGAPRALRHNATAILEAGGVAHPNLTTSGSAPQPRGGFTGDRGAVPSAPVGLSGGAWGLASPAWGGPTRKPARARGRCGSGRGGPRRGAPRRWRGGPQRQTQRAPRDASHPPHLRHGCPSGLADTRLRPGGATGTRPLSGAPGAGAQAPPGPGPGHSHGAGQGAELGRGEWGQLPGRRHRAAWVGRQPRLPRGDREC